MFIKLTTMSGVEVRVNMDLIVEYRRKHGSEETVLYVGPTEDDIQVVVKESPESIDRMIVDVRYPQQPLNRGGI